VFFIIDHDCTSRSYKGQNFDVVSLFESKKNRIIKQKLFVVGVELDLFVQGWRVVYGFL
jgi:hypothetical protein